MPLISQTNYQILTTFVWDYGLRGVPVAGPPGTPMQVTADQAPTCYKVVNWIAQAQDSADPQPPDWKTAGSQSSTSNEVLVRKSISAPFLFDIGDGTTLTTIAGVYVYLMLVPPSDQDQLGTSYPPWDSSLLCVINPTTFQQLLQSTQVNPSGGYAGMPGSPQPSPVLKPSGGATTLTGSAMAIVPPP